MGLLLSFRLWSMPFVMFDNWGVNDGMYFALSHHQAIQFSVLTMKFMSLIILVSATRKVFGIISALN
jgi:hypothetical protein